MSKTLYEEAVADAQKLRQLAEETAKNKIIEAVMPQIRGLVNKRILGEELEDLDNVMLSMPSDEMPPQQVEDHLEEPDLDDEESGTHLEIEAQGDVNIHLSESDEFEEDFVLDEKMSEALRMIIKGDTVNEEALDTDKKLDVLEEKLKRLSLVLEATNTKDLSGPQRKRLNLSYLHCVREAIKIRSEVILTEGKTQERLELKMANIIKEIKNMSKPTRRNIFDFLFEAEGEKKSMEELEEAELSLELSDDEQEELAGAEDAEAVGDTLEDILAGLEVSMEAGDEPAEEEAAEEGGEAAEEGGEAAEEELDLGEGDYSEGSHMDEMDVDEMAMDEILEIDENMLRRELSKIVTEDAAEEADQYGGGEAVGDVMLDIDEEDLINALADELGPVSAGTVAESRRRDRARVSQKQLLEAKQEARQYKKAVTNLKSQLVEMNLFNAKLLYANKLMQNKNLTMKQQKAIVEALDNAKTLREAKLLFKSLTDSLNRKSSKKLTEGSLRTLGSSSRSTRSAQPASNGVEVDRWAVLAGIGND